MRVFTLILGGNFVNFILQFWSKSFPNTGLIESFQIEKVFYALGKVFF